MRLLCGLIVIENYKGALIDVSFIILLVSEFLEDLVRYKGLFSLNSIQVAQNLVCGHLVEIPVFILTEEILDDFMGNMVECLTLMFTRLHKRHLLDIEVWHATSICDDHIATLKFELMQDHTIHKILADSAV